MHTSNVVQQWKLRNVFMLIANTMLRTCVHLATESSDETNLPGTVSILTSWTTLSECAKLVTWVTTTREELRPRENKKFSRARSTPVSP